jgi:prolyl-tRNA synthetase
MRGTQLFLPTLREVPAEAEVLSHQLMLRAGMIRKLASGVYTMLPLGNRVLRKIENIIREEMERQGSQELLMPTLQPAELWRESGRWDVYGPELMRLKDRHNRDFCLGPTHEEVITDLVRREVKSHRQLPLNLYQIQTKFRDEIRPRFGLMRGREFIMKDAYSFDKDKAGLDVSYQKMYEAYCKIFERCGLKYQAVEADSGAIGGSSSHEFMVLAETGEDAVVYCEGCMYGANVEKAEYKFIMPAQQEKQELLHIVDTPNTTSIDAIAKFLGVDKDRIIKTLIVNTDKETVAALIRGDRELNEVKLKNILDCKHLSLAGAEVVEKITGAKTGYAGPIGLKVKIVADQEVMTMVNAVAGANQTDKHYINVNPLRDFQPAIVADIRTVISGDLCPKCGTAMKVVRGIEVGHIFKLGTKYSESMNAFFADENGENKPFIMGCYGIGVGRTMAAAVEQNHDEDGIIWPIPIAPYHAILIPISVKDKEIVAWSEKLYQQFQDAGIEVVYDDREERPGVKYKDADLIGIPIQITIGKKSLAKGNVELKLRKDKEKKEIGVDNVVETVLEIIK